MAAYQLPHAHYGAKTEQNQCEQQRKAKECNSLWNKLSAHLEAPKAPAAGNIWLEKEWETIETPLLALPMTTRQPHTMGSPGPEHRPLPLKNRRRRHDSAPGEL
ncbi:Hypothetical predicted protein [Pelobates cultripes]|uniref:Uncharacterized protein n=1 Tax=Pelobates cultripes TaxID=61616 RepID=A0AAD1TKU6_PELCU|nr:Hypothetical predicted protein [Pelobates cultripes]